jgi:hypothetical protein
MLLIALPLRADACPVMNGTFRFVYKRDAERIYFHEARMLTKVDRGVFSYLVDVDTYYLADGVARAIHIDGREAMLRFTCEPGGTLLQELIEKNPPATWWKRYKILNRNEIEILGNYPGKNGIYRRRQE